MIGTMGLSKGLRRYASEILHGCVRPYAGATGRDFILTAMPDLTEPW